MADCYVHLANGDVKRVKSDEYNEKASVGGEFWTESDAEHRIIGVYPVEVEFEKPKANRQAKGNDFK